MNVSPLWFWSFWHWSTDGFRSAELLRGPIHGIAGHWDEWYHHEASIEERHAIDKVGRSTRAQRQFVRWLMRHWSREAEWRGERPPIRFVLGQLANLPPFDKWPAFARYRTAYGVAGVAAVVLEEGSQGEASDVRLVEALTIPADEDSASPVVFPEGFTADPMDLRAVREATRRLLRGRGLLRLLALWLAVGRRPYPQAIGGALALGWVLAAGLVVQLVVGPDPGDELVLLDALLLGLWTTLLITALIVAGIVGVRTWRYGRRCAERLDTSQLRLRMDGGLSLVGGSAGLPFCVNALASLLRGGHAGPESWLWKRIEHGIRSNGRRWAATGVVVSDGRIGPVTLDPKLRASQRHGGIAAMLIPRRGETGDRSEAPAPVHSPHDELPNVAHPRQTEPSHSVARAGFAREAAPIRRYRCRHLADAVMAIGGLTSRWQAASSGLGVVVSAALLLALPDLCGVLFPPPAPNVVGPSSESPYHVWVSLDTANPKDFSVVLESRFWANRRVSVAAYSGENASVRAELKLDRMVGRLSPDIDDGTVWIERRRRFLTREFAPGERVGRYSLSYVMRLHE